MLFYCPRERAVQISQAWADIEPNIKRQKTYEMTVKVNAMATLISHGFSLEDTVNSIPLLPDTAS